MRTVTECGFLHLTGEPEAPPARFGLSMIDFMTGVVAALGCVAALLARTNQGGRDVDISLFDVALHQLTYPGTWYLNHGIETGRVARDSSPDRARHDAEPRAAAMPSTRDDVAGKRPGDAIRAPRGNRERGYRARSEPDEGAASP